MQQSLGEIIVEYLKEHGLTQAELARKANVTRMTLSRCIAQGAVPSPENFQSLLNAMQLTQFRKVELSKMHKKLLNEVSQERKSWGSEQRGAFAAKKTFDAYKVNIEFDYKPNDEVTVIGKQPNPHPVTYASCRINFKSLISDLPSFSWLSQGFYSCVKVQDDKPVMQQWTERGWVEITSRKEIEILRAIQQRVRSPHIGGVYYAALQELEQMAREKELESPLDGLDHDVPLSSDLFNELMKLVEELNLALSTEKGVERFAKGKSLKELSMLRNNLSKAKIESVAQMNQVWHLISFFQDQLSHLK